jgi:DNA-binding CsgD family transcriptional regulator
MVGAMSVGAMNSDILDDIYAAACDPGRWPDVLQRLGDQFGARGGLIQVGVEGRHRWVSSPEVVGIMEAFEAGGYHLGNPRIERALQRRDPGFMIDHDMMSHEAMAALPMFRDLLWPRGWNVAAGTIIESSTGEGIAMSLEGLPDEATARWAASQMNGLRPAIARAIVLSQRLDIERAQTTVNALRLVGLPAAVTTADGRLLAANADFEALEPEIFRVSRGKLILVGASEAAVAAARANGASIPVCGELDRRVVHVAPIRGRARDVFTGGQALFVAAPVGGVSPLAPDLLGALFDLTPAEARVARHVAAGGLLEEMARARGASMNTLRSQLKAAMAKAGVNRQLELALLLATFTPPTP